MPIYNSELNVYALSPDEEDFSLPSDPPAGANANVVGNELANTLTGNDGNNGLNGGAGADSLIGGKGNDTYVFDDAGDDAVELEGEGTDEILSASALDLNAFTHIENLTLLGNGDVDGVGNNHSNRLYGNVGNNALSGGMGDDWLNGGGGEWTVSPAAKGMTPITPIRTT